MTKKQLMREAKAEIGAWHSLPSGLVLAILFAFIYRITEGESIEDLMRKCESGLPAEDYQI